MNYARALKPNSGYTGTEPTDARLELVWK
jgi:hypothetical protein